MIWQGFFDPMFSSRVCLTLLHLLWQITLITFLAWGVGTSLRSTIR